MKKHSARFELHSADRAFSVAYTNVAGYNCGNTITTPNGSAIRRIVERDEFRRNLVTNCATCFNGSPTYWYSTDYDLLNRPTNATDSVSLVREWLYNRRSELAAASIGTNLYGYAYDTIGNRLWAADNLATNTYAANNLNQYSSILRGTASPCEPAYDADGNMTGDGTFDYAYDAENRLVSGRGERVLSNQDLVNYPTVQPDECPE